MDTILYVADQNAAEVKEAYKRRPVPGDETEAARENREWQAFKAKLYEQRRRVHDGGSTSDDDVDEDDLDALIAIVMIFEAQADPLTMQEITRTLQRQKVLSLEFVAAARAQTLRLLTQLQGLGRISRDAHGRWTLASRKVA